MDLLDKRMGSANCQCLAHLSIECGSSLLQMLFKNYFWFLTIANCGLCLACKLGIK